MIDQATAYARAVVTGEQMAGALVRQACQRHLEDMRQAAAKGLVWRVDRAERAIAFFAEVLYLPERTDAEETLDATPAPDAGVPQPFVLAPWQAFIVGSIFGWYTVHGFRRIREAYIETGKGNGKTPLGAGIMLLLLIADHERAAQVFLAAVTRDQAGHAWRDCRAMVQASPELCALFGFDGFRAQALQLPDGSFLRPVSSEKRGLDGKRVHGALIDELHEQATPIVVNKMRAGTKGRRNALIVKTTNSGFDRTSVCFYHHDYSRKVLGGTLVNESWFAYICGLDPCEACAHEGKWFPSDDCGSCDDWRTEGAHWIKANPNLGVSLPWQYLRERVAQAQGMPTEVSNVLRFNFCVWTAGGVRGFDMGRWAACQPLPSEAELAAADCFGCLDLGETDDFSAFGRLWVLADGRVAVKMRYFLPSAALERYPGRPYAAWQRAGWLTVTDGPVTDYEIVRAAIRTDAAALGMQAVFYDTRTARETAQILTGEGLTMIAMAQGYGLNEALTRLITLTVSGTLCHGDDPILAWMASNTVVALNSRHEKRLAKERSPEKIDGIAALTMGIEGAVIRRQRAAPAPDYRIVILGDGL